MEDVVYLHSGLGQIDSASQVLSDEGVGVVSPLKHSLQSLQLAAVEGGSVPALLSLLLLLCVHLLVWEGRSSRSQWTSKEEVKKQEVGKKKEQQTSHNIQTH